MYSFDIFDTLITRKTIYPNGVFVIMQEKIKSWTVSEYLRDNFSFLRAEAEKNARAWSQDEEITINEIYQALGHMCGITDPEQQKLIQLEIAIEKKCVCGIEKNIKQLLALKQNGEDVILISDMYLSEKNIRNILVSVHPVFEEIPIYVSADYKKTKRSGNLFVEIRRQKQIKGEWIHFGDNQWSDVEIPRLQGIDAKKIGTEALLPCETYIVSNTNPVSQLESQIAIGIAKTIRINEEAEISKGKKAGSSIGGYVLFPYIEWIIKRCVAMKMKSLYFIARDGYILKKMADIYIDQYELDIRTKYIYGSRQAWRVDSQEKRELIIEYFKQIDIGDETFNLVDLQGTGISMQYLSDILFPVFHKELNVFYYSLLEKKKLDFNIYVFSTKIRMSAIELFCRAPHGATTGYEKADGIVNAVTEKMDDRLWIDQGLKDYERGVVEYTEQITNMLLELDIGHIGSVLSNRMLEYCSVSSDRELLSFFGNLSHSDDNNNESQTAYAPILSNRDIFNLYMWKTYEDEKKYYHGHNIEYSVMQLNSKQKKRMIFFNRNYDRFLGKMLHGLKYMIFGHVVLKHKKRVIIYGAGNYGKRAYHLGIGSAGVKVVGWVDRNYRKYQQDGYPVVSLEAVCNIECDHWVIALKGNTETSKVVREIYAILTNSGVDRSKIVFLDEYEKLCMV